MGPLAVLRKQDGVLVGRCGLMEFAVEAAPAANAIPRGWFGRAQVPDDVALTWECDLGYTFDPAAWGQGFATEAAACVRDYARDVLRMAYVASIIHPLNVRSQRVVERFGASAGGQVQASGQTWNRFVWPLASGAAS